jgi:hypothetical protein
MSRNTRSNLNKLLSSMKEEFKETDIKIRQKNGNFEADTGIDILISFNYMLTINLANDYQLRFVLKDEQDNDLLFDMEVFHNNKKTADFFEEFITGGDDLSSIIKEWDSLLTREVN